MSYVLILIVLLSNAFAGLEKIKVNNLNLNYIYPQGSGELDKLSFGAGAAFHKLSYPLNIYRRENSFEIISEIIDIEWLNPFPFAHNIQSASTEQLNLKIEKGEHDLNLKTFKFAGEKTGEFALQNLKVSCRGSSNGKNIILRLKADCLEKMVADIEHMVLPLEFLKVIADKLPETAPEVDLPANDFFLNIEKGDFYSFVRIKLVLPAYLRLWGHTQFEDEGKTIAIRMDTIKYGILPVTSIVMKELARQVNHPSVKIDPPWIRIKLGNR
jgi:hypothetical protein